MLPKPIIAALQRVGILRAARDERLIDGAIGIDRIAVLLEADSAHRSRQHPERSTVDHIDRAGHVVHEPASLAALEQSRHRLAGG